MWAELDVASVVAVLRRSGAELVAGAGAVGRRVGRARLVEDPARFGEVAPEDLVVTSAAVLERGTATGTPIDATVADRIAAVVVVGADPLPPDVARDAERWGLPVIALPGSDPTSPSGPGSAPVADGDDLARAQVQVLEAMVEAQAGAVAAAQERFATLSLEALISGDAASVAEISERAASFGWDLHRPRAVLLASIDAPVDRAALPTALTAIAAAARATLGPDAIVWPRRTTIAALLPSGEQPSGRRRSLAEALRAELDDRLRSVSVSIGVGRVVRSPAELARSYAEAARAVDVGRWARGRHVVEVFDELGLERLLAAAPADEVADFVRHTVGPLLDHDAAHGTDLAGTLAVWLETRNMAEAARRTYVHYNTLKNRLERVEAILGPVLTDAGRALECEVAMHVVRHYDIDL